MEAIYSYTDDLAFFGYQLCSDLMKHGVKVRETLTSKPSTKVPHVSEADFADALKSGLIPPASQYADWMNSFVEETEK